MTRKSDDEKTYDENAADNTVADKVEV